MKKVFTLCLLLSFFYFSAQAQTDSATWALTSNGSSAVSSSAIAAAGLSRRSPDLGTGSFVGFTNQGFGSYEWPSGFSPTDSVYNQYVVAPSGNHAFTVSSIRLNTSSSFSSMNFTVRYLVTSSDPGKDASFFAASTVAGSTSYTTVVGVPTLTDIQGLSISVPPGSVLYVRVYGYANKTNNIFYNSSVSIAGNVCALPDAVTNISGTDTVCAGSLATYFADPVNGADSYIWTVPEGWNILDGQGTATLAVFAGNDSGNKSIRVTALNACGSSDSPRTVSLIPTKDLYSTGYVNTYSSKYSGNITVASSQTLVGAQEGFLKFPLTSLPAHAVIRSSTLTLYNAVDISNTQSFFYHNVTALQTLDPVTAPGPLLFQNIQSGRIDNSAVWGGVGNLLLPLNANGVSNIQTYQSSPGFLSLGLNKVAGSAIYTFSGYTDPAHPPLLSVTYSAPAYAKTVTVNPLPDIAPISGPASLCANTSATYTDEVGGGVWSATNYTGAATISPDGVATGTGAGTVAISYNTTSNYGCTNGASILVTVGALPDAPATEIAQPTCSVATGTVTVTSPVDETYSYSIDSVTYQSSNVFSNIAPGNYTVYVKNSSGCLSSSNVVVNTQPASPAEPVTEITQPTCAIATGTITITSPTETGDIYSLDGVNYQTSNLFSEVAPGIHNVYVINSNGCLASAFATVNPQPALPVAFIVYTSSPYCASGTATVTQTGTTGGVYTSTEGLGIDSSTGAINLAASSAGTYTVTYSFSNGVCSGTATTIVAIKPTPTASISPISALACEGNSVQLFITGTYGASVTYQFNGSGGYAATVPAYITSPNTAGTYIYTLTSVTEDGCAGRLDNSVSSITIRPTPDATISGRSFVQVGSSITLTGATCGGTWSVNNCNLSLSCTNTNPVTAMGKKAGIAKVTYTLPADEYGCLGSDTKVVIVLPDRCSAMPVAGNGASETESSRSLKNGTTNDGEIRVMAYPNPVREAKINLQLANLKRGNYLVSLYSANGQIVYQKKIVVPDDNATQSEVLLLRQPLAQDMYQLRVADNEGTIIKTIKIMAAR